MGLLLVFSILTLDTVLAAHFGTYYYNTKPTCEQIKNLTLSCLKEEIVLLHSTALSIHGNLDSRCDPLVSEQTCYLCRRFNASENCLNMLMESCTYAEMYQFIHSETVLYLGSVASLCRYSNMLQELHANRECYNGIAANLRKCFNVLQDRSCGTVESGFTCSRKISQAYCSTLFTMKSDHKELSALYQRVLEPSIDLQNCTDDSELYIAQVYPEYEHHWKVATTDSLEVHIEIGTEAVMLETTSSTANTIIASITWTALYTIMW